MIAVLSMIAQSIREAPPLDPPEAFAETLQLRREPISLGKCVSECPLCGNEMLECDCSWSAQA